ncbi:MAG: rRNA maturation RNase YbeY [Anaerolineaceae bacterium 4572_5.2]|nr:MAG: rRNA maturation RNase YbeY [Anaerolineaceae bacterium 4572_5.2]
MIHIEINPTLKEPIRADIMEEAAHAALEEQSAPRDAALTILLTDDAQLQSLNRDYLGIDAPTDVLSFPAHERDPETDTIYLGDIIVSLPSAAKQAQAGGHPLEAEIQLLIVHGVLHLLGHDHAEDGEKAQMWNEQAKILARLGLSEIEIQE